MPTSLYLTSAAEPRRWSLTVTLASVAARDDYFISWNS